MDAYYDEWADDLDTMSDPDGYLDAGEIDAFEEGFIRGFNSAP